MNVKRIVRGSCEELRSSLAPNLVNTLFVNFSCQYSIFVYANNIHWCDGISQILFAFARSQAKKSGVRPVK